MAASTFGVDDESFVLMLIKIAGFLPSKFSVDLRLANLFKFDNKCDGKQYLNSLKETNKKSTSVFILFLTTSGKEHERK